MWSMLETIETYSLLNLGATKNMSNQLLTNFSIKTLKESAPKFFMLGFNTMFNPG